MMIFENLNYTGLLAGAALSFGLGYFWYSFKGFGKAWLKAIGKKETELGNPLPALLVSALYLLTISFFLALLASFSDTCGIFSFLGFLLILISALGMLMGCLYQGNAIQLWYINAGYDAVCIVIIMVCVWFL